MERGSGESRKEKRGSWPEESLRVGPRPLHACNSHRKQHQCSGCRRKWTRHPGRGGIDAGEGVTESVIPVGGSQHQREEQEGTDITARHLDSSQLPSILIFPGFWGAEVRAREGGGGVAHSHSMVVTPQCASVPE